MKMETFGDIISQEVIENTYNKRHIDNHIRECILASEDIKERIKAGVEYVKEWLYADYYASKMARLEPIKQMDLEKLVTDIFVGICYTLQPEIYTSVTARMAGRLGFSDRREAIQTVAELLAIVSDTDAYDIRKDSKRSSIYLINNIQLPEQLKKFIKESIYLPPMVCEPKELEHNYSSGYLTHNDSLILGNGNHHDGDICLDVLNLMNKVALQLDTQFLSTLEENPNTEFTVEKAMLKAAAKGECITEAEAKLKVEEQIKHWNTFKGQCYDFYELMVTHNNQFYLTHKVDKRGRIYAQGYHITTQGTAFKKASIELAKEEVVTGVPA